MIAINSLTRITSYLNHLLKLQSDFYIHSPFVFDMVTKVIKDDQLLPDYREIELIRDQLLSNHMSLKINDFGTGAEMKTQRKISRIARTSLKSKKQTRLIHRIARYFMPGNILELGTSFGLTTIYIAKAVPQSNIITIEGCDSIAAMANEYFKNYHLPNIKLFNDNIDNILPDVLIEMNGLDMVFFDANHTYEATWNYFLKCSEVAHNDSIFLFDDIHWSSGMEDAWKHIKASNEVTLTLDLYHMGIVFFKKELSKQDFTLRF